MYKSHFSPRKSFHKREGRTSLTTWNKERNVRNMKQLIILLILGICCLEIKGDDTKDIVDLSKDMKELGKFHNFKISLAHDTYKNHWELANDEPFTIYKTFFSWTLFSLILSEYRNQSIDLISIWWKHYQKESTRIGAAFLSTLDCQEKNLTKFPCSKNYWFLRDFFSPFLLNDNEVVAGKCL